MVLIHINFINLMKTLLSSLILLILIFISIIIFLYYEKTHEETVKNIVEIFIKITLLALFILIFSTIFWILVWLIINWFYINNLNIELTEKVQLLLYIIQILIISTWIFIWYINYKELIRKNVWDHFPKINVLESETTEGNNYDYLVKTAFIQKFTIINLWDNIINIDLDTIKIFWKDLNWKRRLKKIKNTWLRNLFKCYIYAKTNTIYWKEKKEIEVVVNEEHLKNDFKEILYIDFIFRLESYKIKKTFTVSFFDENQFEPVDKEKKHKKKRKLNLKILSMNYN